MNEALTAYRDKLAKDVDGYERALEAMKDGRQQTFEVDRSTGQRVDITPLRISDFTDIITTLRSLIRDLDIKLG
ncbi:hypothetical protein J2W42_002218 [Rhizobium tibeticum]|uniref:hypothetical protein n=1 Tax=Rhizobium tibeticum TaxID=501024 RepID=UPI00277DE674|nr:hypothetical protein [Rhizobium tibeticum]MDP9809370.1 hypothetical protein [Rhizobium tibeticum]